MRTVDAASVFVRAAVTIAAALLPPSGAPCAFAVTDVAGAVGVAVTDVAGAVGVAVTDVAGAVGVAAALWLLAPEPHAVMTAADPQAARARPIKSFTLATRAGPRARRNKWFTKTPFRLPVGVWDAREKSSGGQEEAEWKQGEGPS